MPMIFFIFFPVARNVMDVTVRCLDQITAYGADNRFCFGCRCTVGDMYRQIGFFAARRAFMPMGGFIVLPISREAMALSRN